MLQSICFYLFYILVIFYIYLYPISSLQVIVKGLTTPLSRWVQVFDYLCMCIDWRLVCTSYWIETLVLKLREILISTLLHQPFLFKGKTNASSRSSNPPSRCSASLIKASNPHPTPILLLLPHPTCPDRRGKRDTFHPNHRPLHQISAALSHGARSIARISRSIWQQGSKSRPHARMRS